MAKTSNSRMVLLLIGGIPITMILVSTWLWYFVARGDGSSHFSDNLDEHNRAVRRYQLGR